MGRQNGWGNRAENGPDDPMDAENVVRGLVLAVG